MTEENKNTEKQCDIHVVTCSFDRAWIGKCKKPAEKDLCEEHKGIKCCSCGKRATRECPETMQLVCGAPLCDDCEHTIRHNGYNSGDLPKGYKSHCKKSEQVYKSWMERENDR